MWFTWSKLLFLASIVLIFLPTGVHAALPDALVSEKEKKRRKVARQMQNRGDQNAPVHVIPPQVVVPIGQYVLGVDHFTIDERFGVFSF